MKEFKNLSKTKQNELRKEYKELNKKEYYHAIHLFIIYVCLGIICLFSLLIMLILNKAIGIILFVIFFIILIIIIHFLSLSNLPFYSFLKQKGYKIKKK